MKPNADHKAVITYTIIQKTTAPEPRKTIAAFEAELKLQYGSTVEITSVMVDDGRPPQTEDPFADDLDQADREALVSARALVHVSPSAPVRPVEDLHSETTGRVRGW